MNQDRRRPDRNQLKSILERAGIHLSEFQYDQLWRYHELLRAADAVLNLTRIRNFEQMVLKHYVDSLIVLKFAELPSPLMDLGSGPGLPGIPLKIARPDLQLILAEPRGLRAKFLRDAADDLGLEDVEVYDRKVTSRFHRKVAGVITRAVASIPETLEMVANCLDPGGRMIFMKGPDCDAEIVESRSAQASTFRLEKDRTYALPGAGDTRRIVIYERIGAATGGGTPEREILSQSNPMFRQFRELLKGKGIRESGQALISGPKIIDEVLARHRDFARGWITDVQSAPPEGECADLPWYRLSGPLFQDLDVAGTKSPILLAAVPEITPWHESDPWPPGCTLFLPFQDPENVGAAIRSAAGFGVARVVLLREAAHPFHPKALRAAGRSVFEVPLHSGPPLAELQAGAMPLISLSTEGPALADEPWPASFGLVAGVEGPGLPEHLRQGLRRRIPTRDAIESLNAAASIAVALYDWQSRSPGDGG